MGTCGKWGSTGNLQFARVSEASHFIYPSAHAQMRHLARDDRDHYSGGLLDRTVLRTNDGGTRRHIHGQIVNRPNTINAMN